MRLAEAGWLWLLPLALLPWAWGLGRRRIDWPSLAGFGPKPSRTARVLKSISPVVRGVAIVGLVVALARPQVAGGTVRVAGRGVAILAAIDRSSSMNAADFPSDGGPVSRLEGARRTLARFVEGRSDDLVGLVAFARYPDLLAAPTLDQGFLLDAIRSIRPAGAIDDGTNLGDALAWALGAIRDAPARRKVVILLTDGRDAPAVPNPLDPLEAATIARGLGVVVHTIALGGEGPDGPDLPLLARIAGAGGGQAYAATDAGSLARVFAAIDALEKSPVAGTVRTLYRERFSPWAALTLGVLILDVTLSSGRLRSFP
ncbi:VWA domain-containing protein [Tundrisphaera sp. TA3]|uniref:VWA domain-containing protein n=1 Tax=Tundrisphaera sp. TA3 TaxID=3435775 RepID=UPI003EB697C0